MNFIFTSVLSWLGNLLGGPFIKAALDGYKAKLQADGSHEAKANELAIKEMTLDTRQAEVNAQIILAEQGNWLTRLPRPVMGLSVACLVFKILVWDLALGQWTGGHTDKLSTQAFWLVTTIVIAYFGTRSVERVADKIAGVLKK